MKKYELIVLEQAEARHTITILATEKQFEEFKEFIGDNYYNQLDAIRANAKSKGFNIIDTYKENLATISIELEDCSEVLEEVKPCEE